jgi:predicted house-cleaning NTP pyrophosphatase (Maf/HAM1 superfamily)
LILFSPPLIKISANFSNNSIKITSEVTTQSLRETSEKKNFSPRETLLKLERAKEGVFIETWDNFVVFRYGDHYIVMDEDRNKVHYIAHSKEEALNFLISEGGSE